MYIIIKIRILIPNICKRLNDICHKYNIKIVITSTWRINIPEQIQQIFYDNNINVEIVGLTGVIHSGDRGEEILDYVNNGFISKFAIIDDNIEYIKPYFKDNLISVEKSYVGITEDNLNQLASIFV